MNDKNQIEKTTTGDEEKRYRLIQKLISHNAQLFREIDINDYDFNITESFQQLEYIDDVVTPLIYCAHYGLKEICKFLLKNKKIDIDLQTTNNGQTPLIIACLRGNYQIVRLLVLAGAEINKPNCLNHSPLTITIFRLVQEPLTFQNKNLCFRLAEFLVDHGADINWIVDKKKGYSLLHYFCAMKTKTSKSLKQLNLTIIKFLLEKGADPKQKTLKDQTCYELLENNSNAEVIKKLLTEVQLKNAQAISNKIPKHNITKLGDNYFKLPNQK